LKRAHVVGVMEQPLQRAHVSGGKREHLWKELMEPAMKKSVQHVAMQQVSNGGSSMLSDYLNSNELTNATQSREGPSSRPQGMQQQCQKPRALGDQEWPRWRQEGRSRWQSCWQAAFLAGIAPR
jgi:hypothetical protein